jgi:CHAT domain-containing protein
MQEAEKTGTDPQQSALERQAPQLDSAGQRQRGTAGPSGFERLPGSRYEAEAIANLAPGRVLRFFDFKASRPQLSAAELDGYRVVHLATHGVIDTERPALSGLVLSLVDQQGQPQEGLLGLNDIYNLRLHADLVVLSGCRTALGRELKGEGLIREGS